MILIITNRQDYTADYLIVELLRRQLQFVRLNTEDFPQAIKVNWQIDSSGLKGYFQIGQRHVRFQDIRSVWYRRPVAPVPDPTLESLAEREFVIVESLSALEGILACLDCLWVSRPHMLRRAELKPFQLYTALGIGFCLSPSIITNIPEQASEFYIRNNPRVVFKPLRQGRVIRGEQVGLIYTNIVDEQAHLDIAAVKYSPTLLQKYVSKAIEIRVTVIGDKVFAAEIRSQAKAQSQHDWRRIDATELIHKPHVLPIEVESKCRTLVSALDLKFGAIDLILTPEDDYVFLEINPNGQWAWIQQMCPEIHLREALADLLEGGKNETPNESLD